MSYDEGRARDNELAAWRRLYFEAARTDLKHPFDRTMMVSALRIMTMAHVLLGKMVAGGAVSINVMLTQEAVDSVVGRFREVVAEGVPKAEILNRIADTLEDVGPDLVGTRPLPIDVLYLAMQAWSQDEPFLWEDYAEQAPGLYAMGIGEYAEFLGLARRVPDGPERAESTVPPSLLAFSATASATPPAPSTRIDSVCDALAGAADLVATNPQSAAAIIRNAIATLRRS